MDNLTPDRFAGSRRHRRRRPNTKAKRPRTISIPQDSKTVARSSDSAPEAPRPLLPENYQAAQKALAQCVRIDECKSWSDKAAALATYARQAKDRSLFRHVTRIRARAQRRMGGLLKQIPSGRGSKNQHGELRKGTLTRQKAAQDAGLSKAQMITALRIASLPGPQFEALVESDDPPTVTRLAKLGTAIRVPAPQSPAEPNSTRAPMRSARARKVLKGMLDFCRQSEPAALAATLTGQDQELLREIAARLPPWLDQLKARLCDARAGPR